MSLAPLRVSLTAFHWPGFSGSGSARAGCRAPSPRYRRSGRERSSAAGGHPVDLDALGLEQEGEPVEGGVDHHLAGLVEEFVVRTSPSRSGRK